jgi:hypothetical protein
MLSFSLQRTFNHSRREFGKPVHSMLDLPPTVQLAIFIGILVCCIYITWRVRNLLKKDQRGKENPGP